MEMNRKQLVMTLLWGGLVLCVAMGFARFGYTVILPYMQEGLGFNYTQMGLIGTANFIGYLVGAYICGWFADRFGKKNVVQFSLLIVAITLLLTGLTESFALVFILRLLTGITNAAAFVIMLSLAMDWFPVNKMGTYTGILIGGVGAGITLSGLMIPWIAGFMEPGWVWSWIILGLCTLIVFTGSQFTLKEKKQEPKKVELNPSASYKYDMVLLLIVRKPALLAIFSAYLLEGMGYVVQSTFYVAFMQGEHQIQPMIAGYIWSLVGFGAIVSGIMWGNLADRLGRKKSLVMAYSIQIVSILLPILYPHVVIFALSAGLFGGTFPGIVTVVTMITRSIVDAHQVSRAIGLMTVMYGLGQFIGPGIAGYIVDMSHSFYYAFLFSAAVVFLGLILFIPFQYDEPQKKPVTAAVKSSS